MRSRSRAFQRVPSLHLDDAIQPAPLLQTQKRGVSSHNRHNLAIFITRQGDTGSRLACIDMLTCCYHNQLFSSTNIVGTGFSEWSKQLCIANRGHCALQLMVTGTAYTGVFIFLIDALGLPDHSVEKRLEKRFERHQDRILADTRSFTGSAVFVETTSLYMTYREQMYPTGRCDYQFQFKIPDVAFPLYTYRCDMTVVNGKVEELFFDNPRGDRRRIDNWVSSTLKSTTLAISEGEPSVSRLYNLHLSVKRLMKLNSA
jgi:hypothetical protein